MQRRFYGEPVAHTRTHTHAHTHTEAFKHGAALIDRLFYTNNFLYRAHFRHTHTHAHRLLTETALHRGPATQRPLYTETLFSERPFVHTDELLHKDPYIHAEAFTQSRFYTQRRLYRVASTGDPSRHRAGLTHTHTHRLLHRDPFTQTHTETLLYPRPFHTQTRLRTEQLLHRDPCRETPFLHRSFSASKNFLHTETQVRTEVFAQRPLYI